MAVAVVRVLKALLPVAQAAEGGARPLVEVVDPCRWLGVLAAVGVRVGAQLVRVAVARVTARQAKARVAAGRADCWSRRCKHSRRRSSWRSPNCVRRKIEVA